MGLDILAPVEINKLKHVGGFTLSTMGKVDNDKIFLADSNLSGFNFTPYIWKLDSKIGTSNVGYIEPRVYNGEIYWVHGNGLPHYKYNPISKNLTALSSDNVSLRKCTATLSGDNIHVFGGFLDTGEVYRNSTYHVYNIPGNVWNRDDNFGYAVDDACSWEFNGIVYIYGGWYGGWQTNTTAQVTNQIAIFDPSKRPLRIDVINTSLPAVFDSANTKCNGEVYIMGGENQWGGTTNGFYKSQTFATWSFANWRELIRPPIALSEHCMVTFGKYIYVIGGDSTANTIFNKKLLRYNTDFDIKTEQDALADPKIRANAWEWVTDSSYGMSEGGAVSIGNKIYTIGGYSGSISGTVSSNAICVYDQDRGNTELLIERIY